MYAGDVRHLCCGTPLQHGARGRVDQWVTDCTSLPPLRAPHLWCQVVARACTRKKGGKSFRVGIFLISPARLHARPMGRTRRRAGETELTAIGVELNGSGRVPTSLVILCDRVRYLPRTVNEPTSGESISNSFPNPSVAIRIQIWFRCVTDDGRKWDQIPPLNGDLAW